MEFDPNNTAGPKTFAKFIARLGEVAPRLMLKQLVELSRLLDSESYVIRMSLIDVVGDLLIWLLDGMASDNGPELAEQSRKDQMEQFFDIIEERFRDMNAFVRCKVLQVVSRVCKCKAKFPSRRTRLIDLTISRLEDKSAHVRANSIKTLIIFIQTHPFAIDGGELNAHLFKSRMEEINKQMTSIKAPKGLQEEFNELEEAESADGNPDNFMEKKEAEESAQQVAIFMKLQLQQKYYSDALVFIQQLRDAIPILCQLLSSKNKTEVVDTMEFFVVAYKYKLNEAVIGVQQMIHLVWNKDGGTEETRSVRSHLIRCFQSLYLEFDENTSQKENVNRITRQLISLTFEATLADLTSLDELLSVIVTEGAIHEDVVQRLWAVYGSERTDIPKAQRRGAILILGMLARANYSIIANNLDVIMRVGLSALGQCDLTLARFSLIALQRLVPSKKGKGVQQEEYVRLPMNADIFSSMKSLILTPTRSLHWFSTAEEAVNAIFLLCDQADALASEVLKEMFMIVTSKLASESESSPISSFKLAQLLFIAGHVAIKEIVLLEDIEATLKRRKADEKGIFSF